ncbi:putative leader peptide [Streptomyces sp. NPDC055709]
MGFSNLPFVKNRPLLVSRRYVDLCRLAGAIC